MPATCRPGGAANSAVAHRPSARPSAGCLRCPDRRGSADAVGQSEPDRPLRLELPGERAIIDQRIADRFDAACGRQRVAPAPACSRRPQPRSCCRVCSPRQTDRASGRRNTKAGIEARSAKLSQRSFAISEVSTSASACARATSARKASGRRRCRRRSTAGTAGWRRRCAAVDALFHRP